MKKLLAVLLSAIMVLSLAACGGNTDPTTQAAEKTTEAETPTTEAGFPTDGPEVTIQLAHADTEASNLNKVAIFFKDEIEKKSSGKIKVALYPNSQLGSDSDNLTSVKTGDLQAAMLALSLCGTEASCAYSCSIPFLLAGWSTEKLVALSSDSEWREAMNAGFEKSGIKLGNIIVGQPMYFNTIKPIETFEGFAGQKIRTAQSASSIAMVNALGATATPLAYSELYMSLQQNLVDGWYNQPCTIIASKAYEQAKYVTTVAPSISFVGIILNDQFVKGLPEAYQALINEVLLSAQEYGNKIYAEALNADIQTLKDNGVTFIEADQAFVDKCIAAEPDAVQEQKDRVEDKTVLDALDKSIEKLK